MSLPWTLEQYIFYRLDTFESEFESTTKPPTTPSTTIIVENYDALLKKLLGNSGTPDDISTKNFSDATNHESDKSSVEGFEHFQDRSQNDL